MKRIALLDVNVLVALFFAGHSQHQAAHDWFEDYRGNGWATCAITENGAVRVLSNRTLVLDSWTPAEAIEQLRVFRRSAGHQYWPHAVSLTDQRLFNPSVVHGHKQLPDVYLLGLATAEGGAFATFDRSIPVGAVRGATADHLIVISAAPEESRSEDR